MFPFNYLGVSHDKCTFYHVDDIENEKVENIYFDFIIVQSLHVQPWCATKLEDVPASGNVASWDFCGPDCPIGTKAWKKDDTLKVTHHSVDQKDTMIAMKLLGIMSLSLLLITLMVNVLGISYIWFWI